MKRIIFVSVALAFALGACLPGLPSFSELDELVPAEAQLSTSTLAATQLVIPSETPVAPSTPTLIVVTQDPLIQTTASWSCNSTITIRNNPTVHGTYETYMTVESEMGVSSRQCQGGMTDTRHDIKSVVLVVNVGNPPEDIVATVEFLPGNMRAVFNFGGAFVKRSIEAGEFSCTINDRNGHVETVTTDSYRWDKDVKYSGFDIDCTLADGVHWFGFAQY